jgi:AcrR family transcriptional regulator
VSTPGGTQNDQPEPATTASRRRGRPRRDQGPAVTREAIIAVALESVRNHGLGGLALREVARKLDVSLPSVQNHFRTLNDLWRGCVDQAVTERRQALDAIPGPVPNGTPGAAITAVIRMQIEQAAGAPGLTMAMWNDPDDGADERLDYLTDRCEPIFTLARAQIEAAIAAGVLRPIDPSALIALLSLGLSSVANTQEGLRRLFGIDLDDAAQRDRFAAALADILLYGLLSDQYRPSTT